MNIAKYMGYLLLGLVLSLGLAAAEKVRASEDGATPDPVIPATQSGELYLPSEDSMADLAAALEGARESKRLLLVVLGANWCHDSRALASRLYTEPLVTTINERYEILFVDVGYLEKGRDVISSLGIPVYYATPTVLIIDPVSGRVLNAQNRHQWANAAEISMQESLEYFRQFANTDQAALPAENEPGADLQALFTEIESFEQVQADRLYQAYAVLAPMLQAYKEGDKDAFSEEKWNEVRDYRYKVPVDIESLKNEARQRVAAGETDINLSYPVYPAFSWDTP